MLLSSIWLFSLAERHSNCYNEPYLVEMCPPRYKPVIISLANGILVMDAPIKHTVWRQRKEVCCAAFLSSHCSERASSI